MNEEPGQERVAELVKAAMGWRGISGPQIDATGRVSRATVDRVKRRENVSDAMLRALGDILGLPRDYLLYVRNGDVEAVISSGATDPDLLRWTLELMQDEITDDQLSDRSQAMVDDVLAIRRRFMP
ncbi:MAG: hypothetical protein ACRDPJ_09620 [Nocardioidaceae bacterium]